VVKLQSKQEFKNWISQIKTSENELDVIPPNVDDLYSLYRHCRLSNSIAAVEIGSGWSTTIIAKALSENQFSNHELIEKLRHPNPFALMTLDCSKKFLEVAKKRQKEFAPMKVSYIKTSARYSIVRGQVCSLFRNFPQHTSDFIYLDGPACNQVKKSVRGFHGRFGNRENYGLPMSGDLLTIENWLWPGTIIVVDGRGANAAFLRDSFQRNWNYRFDTEVDQHIFYLDEKPWGKYSELLLTLKQQWISDYFRR